MARGPLLPGREPDSRHPMEASEMKARRRRASPRDPDSIYEGAQIELPWIVEHIAGEETPWDEEFNF
jgi:hypothetical protein